MVRKLTLTIEKSIIENAKVYAKQTGRSLSNIIETYLQDLVNKTETKGVSAKLKKIAGSITLPEDFDEKKELEDYVKRKHL